ncbi:MAG: rRNA maturation RNase YbeY [bacterium]|nr:rRNA maturation RNase YbeY [bacterium]
MSVSILNKTKGKLPRLPFASMKDAVLGAEYELSLVFVGDAESRRINIETRDKDYVPNVLSFELDDWSGEIFINPKEAARQAKDFGRTPSNMIVFLYIHGLCHLKGLKHGSKMERTEVGFRKEFGI